MPNPIVLIDGTLFSEQPVGQNDAAAPIRSSFCGPIEVGSSLYLVLGDNQRPVGATFAILIYKSLDNGATWNLVSGTTQVTSLLYQWTSVGFASPRIWILYSTTTGSPDHPVLHVVAFNTDTDTWETPIDVPISPDGTDLREWDLTVQTDSVLTVVYTIFTGAVFRVRYVRYNGATWGSDTVLSSSDGTAQCGIFLDPITDTSHVFYTGRDVFGIGPLRATLHRAIDSSGVLGADTQLLPAPVTPTSEIYPALGVGCIWNDKIIVPLNRNTGSRVTVPSVFIGTPVSSPVWTFEDLPVDDPDGRADYFTYAHCVALLDADGALNVFWGTIVWDIDFNVPYPNLFLSIDSGSGFNTVSIPDGGYYDSVTDPPTPGLADDGLRGDGVFMPSAALLSTGFGVILQLILDTTGDFGYDAQPDLYIAAGAVPPTPLSITCGGSPSGSVGVAYSNFLPVTGGTPPYTFAIIAGSLPPGLVLNSTSGEISGTPTTPGTYPFTVQVTDSLAAVASVDCSIVIISTLLIECGDPPIGVVGVFYSYAFPVSGGVPPYVITIVAGFLPPGLTLDSATGIISGIPTQGGTYVVTINVTDAALTSMNVVCSITIGQVDVGCTEIQSGTVGVPYSQAFPATGGTPPYTFRVASGQLPFGLTLDPVTGVLSGTPLAPGEFQVVVEVTDANGIIGTAICIHVVQCQ